MKDRLLKFLFHGAPVRGELVRMSQSWQQMTAHHEYPAPVKQLLGEMVAAAALLASNIKFNGALVMQVHGDGPVKLLVVGSPGKVIRTLDEAAIARCLRNSAVYSERGQLYRTALKRIG